MTKPQVKRNYESERQTDNDNSKLPPYLYLCRMVQVSLFLPGLTILICPMGVPFLADLSTVSTWRSSEKWTVAGDTSIWGADGAVSSTDTWLLETRQEGNPSIRPAAEDTDS